MTEKPAATHINHTREEKIRYLWQAKAEGLTLGEWARKHLNEVCDKANTPKPDSNK